jgi:hypothetical protein
VLACGVKDLECLGQQEARGYPSRTWQRPGQDHHGVLLDLAEPVRRRPRRTLRHRRPGRAGAGRVLPVAAGAEDHGRAGMPGLRPHRDHFRRGQRLGACCGEASGFGPDDPNVPLPGRNGPTAASARSCCPPDQARHRRHCDELRQHQVEGRASHRDGQRPLDDRFPGLRWWPLRQSQPAAASAA